MVFDMRIVLSSFDKFHSSYVYMYEAHTLWTKYSSVIHSTQATRGWLTAMLYESLRNSQFPSYVPSPASKGGRGTILDMSYKQQLFSVCSWSPRHLKCIQSANLKSNTNIKSSLEGRHLCFPSLPFLQGLSLRLPEPPSHLHY